MQTQTYIVTGGNSGLGYQCARFLGAIPGNLVVIACRDLAKGAQAAGRLKQIGCAIKVLPLDLASFASVHKFAEEYRRSALPPLAGVVCNAGVQNVAAPTQTAEGYEITFGVNHLAQYCKRLAALVMNPSAATAGKYYSNGREAKSSKLSYNKENAAELWRTSADMVSLPEAIA